jgi:hypothetical protein
MLAFFQQNKKNVPSSVIVFCLADTVPFGMFAAYCAVVP